MLHIRYMAAALVLSVACGALTEDACPAEPWEAALEDWVAGERGNLTRHGRIMSLPPTQGYYVSDRIDLVPPPPPHGQHGQHGQHGPHGQHGQHAHMHHRGPYPAAPSQGPGPHHGPPPPPGHSYNQGGPQNYSPSSGSYQPSSGPSQGPPASYNPQSSGSTYGPPAPAPPAGAPAPPQYDEWHDSPPPPPPSPAAGKIVNKPPNPYKDKFKPSYPVPAPQPIPVNDRVDAAAPTPPNKAVSETDLYLLRAIEKLVYRADLMEKRMRKMEENMHYIVTGAQAKPDPCSANFTRVGAGCYHLSAEAANWKGASFACRKLKANLLELDADEKRRFEKGLLQDNILKGAELWTGGLNPGLLWIWSHSAKPVATNTTSEASGASAIPGEGRCLALVPSSTDYRYQGQDCSLRHRYVCERDDDNEKLSNEIERVAKSLREGKRKPKIALELL